MRMDIENLLRWAFVHELGKGGGVEGIANMNSAWRTICDLGVRIDRGSTGAGYGDGSNFMIEQGEPHRDARLIGEAVRDLAGVEIGGFDGWDAFADVPELADALADVPGRMAARMAALPPKSRRELPVTLVVSVAMTGKAPDWRWPERPRAQMVTRGGKPAWFARRQMTDAFGIVSTVEVDGYNPKRQRPLDGAYRKYRVEPDAFGVALARMDWQIWVLSLGLLVEALSGALADYEVVPALHSPTPWIDGDASARPLRILEAV
jgi:hypothetical protein